MITAPAAAKRRMANKLFFVFILSSVCHLVIVPLAAWNHNLFLVIVAAFAPMVIMGILRKVGVLPPINYGPKHWAKSILRLGAYTALGTVLFWNHLWLLAIVVFTAVMFINGKIKK